MNETMGQIIRRLRKEKNLTQEELAIQLNVTNQAVSKWENDSGLPDISQVVPLSVVFGVSTDVLFGRYNANDEATIDTIPAFLFFRRFLCHKALRNFLKLAKCHRENFRFLRSIFRLKTLHSPCSHTQNDTFLEE